MVVLALPITISARALLWPPVPPQMGGQYSSHETRVLHLEIHEGFPKLH